MRARDRNLKLRALVVAVGAAAVLVGLGLAAVVVYRGRTPASAESDGLAPRVADGDAGGPVTQESDGFGRLAAVHHRDGSSISFRYDSLDRRIGVTVGDRFEVTYTYDYRGRLARIGTPRGDVTLDYREVAGEVIRTLPNGVRTVFVYRPDGLLATISHVDAEDQLLGELSYGYRPDGRIAWVDEWWPAGPGSTSYEYDLAGRLAAVEDSRRGRVEYRYDLLGNRLERIDSEGTTRAAYDWQDRLIEYAGSATSHDAAGNLASLPGSSGPVGYGFDAGGRLTKAVTERGEVAYRYDADGTLLSRTAAGVETRFYSDPVADTWRPLLAAADSGRETLYVWQGTVPLIAISEHGAEFFLHDHAGSIRGVTGPDGSLARQHDYGPFGEPGGGAAGGVPFKPGFAGLFFDPEASLYLTRRRAYAPSLGRFLQPELRLIVPDGSQRDLPGYIYCADDPVNRVDLTGADGESSPYGQRPLDFLRWLNQIQAHYQWVLSLGWTSGVRTHREILREADGRFQLIDITASSPHGIPGDVLNVTRDLSNARGPDRATPYTSDHVLAHSVGATLYFSGRPELIYVDPFAGRGLDNERIDRPGMVANLSGLQLDLRGDTPFVGVVGRFGSNPLEGVAEAGRDLARLPLGVLQVLASGVRTPANPFKPHELAPYLEEYERQQRIPLAGAFDQGVVLRTWDGYFLYRKQDDDWVLERFSERPIELEPVDERRLFPDQLPPGGGGGPDPPGGGGSWPGPSGGGGSPMVPSPVGGVYLRGAGEALAALGPLTGVAVDATTGRIVLLAEERGEIELPPLRLDDLVTVFRSVYRHGDAPFLSIDPDPANPTGPSMLVRHGPGTDDTYVGWVLFQADRVMKAYSLGFDNETEEPVRSRVEGYRSLLDLGFSDPAGGEPVWERFWIVPASVRRARSQSGDLTLLDVRLKVDTERMVLRDGRLETALDARPSPQAERFAQWFSRHYGEIGREAFLPPPSESGLEVPVAFFAELERIAAVAAVAEALRDQGVPFPAWMDHYPVRPVPTPPATRAITVSATEAVTEPAPEGGARTTETTRRIYGGVGLSPEDAAIATEPESPQVEATATALRRALTAAPLLTPVPFDDGERRRRSVALPGEGFQALAANMLAATDLAVPVQRGAVLRLTRRFHSFFQPDGELGPGWSWDLPRLDRGRRPVRRTANGGTYQEVYWLTSPLGSQRASFATQRRVAEAGADLLVPDEDGLFLGLAAADEPRIGMPTTVLVFRDGRRWHFDGGGDLAAAVAEPLTVIYRRDVGRRVRRIEGWYGDALRADVQLEYDARGRVAAAAGSDGQRVFYRYADESGCLGEVEGPAGSVRYECRDSLVMAEHRGRMTRRFEYGPRGELLRETSGAGTGRMYSVLPGEDGTEIRATTGSGRHEWAIRYDRALRPLAAESADGSRVQWRYAEGGGTEIRFRDVQGREHAVSGSADGREVTWSLPEGGRYAFERDDAGRPTAVARGDRPLLRQRWRPDGQLAASEFETVVLLPQYRVDGVLSSVLAAPPAQGEQLREWLEVGYDELGRTVEVTDSAGAEVQIGYDHDGRLAAARSNRAGVRIERDERGRPRRLETSFGQVQETAYDAAGLPERIEVVRDGERAVVRYEEGLPVAVRQFDGGEVELVYHRQGPRVGLLAEVRAPHSLVLRYAYDARNWISTVTVGDRYRLRYSYDASGRLTDVVREQP